MAYEVWETEEFHRWAHEPKEEERMSHHPRLKMTAADAEGKVKFDLPY